MVKTARVISPESAEDVVGLFDTVTLFFEEDNEEQTIRLVTTLRQNALKGLISKESPLGSSIMGHAKGDRVNVKVNDSYNYYVVIRAIEKGEDDDTLDISAY